jgi:hypothetical protein
MSAGFPGSGSALMLYVLATELIGLAKFRSGMERPGAAG